MLSGAMTTIERRDITAKNIDAPKVKCVATYQWKGNTLVVPGIPNQLRHPLPSGRDLPRLASDGEEFMDENHYRYPTKPLQPCLHAIKMLCPEFPQEWSKIDFVTDRNNLRKLIRFINGTNDKEFNIHLDTAPFLSDRTCLLTRIELHDKEQCSGYGHSFERAMVRGGGHLGIRRIMRFQLGDLNLLVRTEVDAFEMLDDVSDHANIQPEKWEMPGSPPLFCESGGDYRRNNNAIGVEFKTKNQRFKHEFDWNHVGMQMIFGGVEKLVVGWMEGHGVVGQIDVFSVDQVKQRMQNIEPTLGKLENVLKTIQEMALKQKGSYHLSCSPNGPLRIKPTCECKVSADF